MSPIPWRAILTHGPAIVATARSLLATQQSRPSDERDQHAGARLERLEKASVETARLLQEMAEQLQAITLAQQEMQRRLQTALIASIVAAVIAVAALIVALVS